MLSPLKSSANVKLGEFSILGKKAAAQLTKMKIPIIYQYTDANNATKEQRVIFEVAVAGSAEQVIREV